MHYVMDVNKYKEVWARKGKPEWPDMIRLQLPRSEAFHMLEQLATALNRQQDDTPIELYLHGEIRTEEE